MSDISSPRATKHWFLDLDGVRSGPYQTPEVMSLIAEGEVMPHHRISTALKDKNWITILDWRFEQAKRPSVHEKEVKEIHSYLPVSSQPPVMAEPEVEAAPIHPEPSAEESPVELAKELATEPALNGWAETPIIEPTPPVFETPIAATRPPLISGPVIQRTPPHFAEEKPEPEIPAPASTAPNSKRDPMAEMFDVIQTSKQKREAKSQQIAQQQNQPAPVATEIRTSSGLTRTLIIGTLITAVGFALGQVFQQSTPPSSSTNDTKNTTAAPPPPKVEIIDRSTDKMTIRGRVETQVQHPTATPTSGRPALSAQVRTAPLNAGGARVEKELQDLKDLKKELQELKALKEELKSGGSIGTSPEEMPEEIGEFENGNVGDTEVDSGFNYYPNVPSTTSGGAAYDTNGYPTQPQNPTRRNNGQTPANSDINY